MPENEQLKFSLCIWPKVKGNGGEEYLKVALYTEKVPEILREKVTIKETFYQRCCKRGMRRPFWLNICLVGYPETELYQNRWLNEGELVPVEELLDPSTGYLKRGTLTVLTQVTESGN